MRTFRTALVTGLLTLATLTALPSRADADITAFFGAGIGPETRSAKGISFGLTVVVLGFEVEYADISAKNDETRPAPRVQTGMVNAIVQTPTPGVQLYGTAGVGAYRESWLGEHENNTAFNIGGGLKMSVLGPLKLRVDYRLFTLRGNPVDKSVHRVYAGLNASF